MARIPGLRSWRSWSLRAVPLVVGFAVVGCSSGSNPVPAEGAADASAGDGGVAPLKFSDIGNPVKVSDAFYFTEGPVWDPAKGGLYFTDANGPPSSAEGGAGDAAAAVDARDLDLPLSDAAGADASDAAA